MGTDLLSIIGWKKIGNKYSSKIVRRTISKMEDDLRITIRTVMLLCSALVFKRNHFISSSVSSSSFQGCFLETCVKRNFSVS
jgi:hypothetical protein